MRPKINLPLLLLILFLPMLVLVLQRKVFFRSKAMGTSANIKVDFAQELNSDWPQNLLAIAQGGEAEADGTPTDIAAILARLKPYAPMQIRLDHLFDFYIKVTKENGRLNLNFDRLDRLVNQMRQNNIRPFFSLTYMPLAISAGDITDAPTSWKDYEELIRLTIEHYSGKKAFNLENIYYEVGNEPDLFGKWFIGQGNFSPADCGQTHDYRCLYFFALAGASKTEATQNFKIGGPAATALYEKFVKKFLEFAKKTNLRFDFVSWHRYSFSVEAFEKDLDTLSSWLSELNFSKDKEKIISEYGFDSENNPLYDDEGALSFYLSLAGKLAGKSHLSFIFELKDGPSPKIGQTRWGRFGLFDNGDSPKSSFSFFDILKTMQGSLVETRGEGTFVHALSSKKDRDYFVLIANFDSKKSNSELVPVSIKGLDLGKYQLTQFGYRQGKLQPISRKEVLFGQNTFKDEFLLPPQKFILLKLTRLHPQALFNPGFESNLALSVLAKKQAVSFQNLKLDLPLEISFNFKPFWEGNDGKIYGILEIPMSDSQIALVKKPQGFGNILELSLNKNGQMAASVALSVSDWPKDQWKKIDILVQKDLVKLNIGEKLAAEKSLSLDTFPAENFFLGATGNIDSAAFGLFDNLIVKVGEREILRRDFEGDLE